MPGCRPPCVSIFSGTDRQKWNYVKNLYQPSYGIYENGDIDDPRDTDDAGYVSDFEKYDEQYTIDHDTWLTYYSNIPFEKWLQWQYEYGTTAYGNLPQHTRNDHSGHCWMPCPYSTDSSDERSELMLGFTPSTKNDHGDYFMKTQNRGGMWVFECTYSGCPYFVSTGGIEDIYGNVISGSRYFYV